MEEPALTIEQHIDRWKTMMSELKPKKPRSAQLIKHMRHGSTSTIADFEQYRPSRDDRWLGGAPEDVFVCYDNNGKSIDRYTVLFGGNFWSPKMARDNWLLGVDPRVMQCLSMSESPAAQQGISRWGQCLPNAYLGRKIVWYDLPKSVREYVWLHINHIGK